MEKRNHRTIKCLGVFDSGIGGLTILNAIKSLGLEKYIYVADTAYLPYGQKTQKQIQDRCIHITRFLIDQGVDAIVIACHTACSAALQLLREQFPDMLFIDMIDGTVECAHIQTKNNTIGVIATQATVDTHVYTHKLHSKKNDLRVIERACPQLVPLIEENIFDIQNINHILKIYLTPLILRNIDTLIIGCTHYILIQDLIRQVVGSNVIIINAQQPTKRALEQLLPLDYLPTNNPDIKLYVTGKTELFYNPYATTLVHQPQQIAL